MIWYHHIHNMNSCWASLFLPTETVIEGKERCSHLILEIETCIWDQPTPPPLGKGLHSHCSAHRTVDTQRLAYRFSQVAEDSMTTSTATSPSCEAPFQRLIEWHFQTSNKKEMQNISGSHSHQFCQRKYLTQGSALKALTNLSVKAGDQQKLELTRNLRNPRFIHTPYSWVGNKTTKKTSNQNNKKTNKSPKQTNKKNPTHTKKRKTKQKNKTRIFLVFWSIFPFVR